MEASDGVDALREDPGWPVNFMAFGPSPSVSDAPPLPRGPQGAADAMPGHPGGNRCYRSRQRRGAPTNRREQRSPPPFRDIWPTGWAAEVLQGDVWIVVGSRAATTGSAMGSAAQENQWHVIDDGVATRRPELTELGDRRPGPGQIPQLEASRATGPQKGSQPQDLDRPRGRNPGLPEPRRWARVWGALRQLQQQAAPRGPGQ